MHARTAKSHSPQKLPTVREVAPANEGPRKEREAEAAFGLVSSRPDALAQRRVQAMAHRASSVRKVEAVQEIADRSPHAMRSVQLQTAADSLPAARQRSIPMATRAAGPNADAPPLRVRGGVLQAVFDLNALEGTDNATYASLMNLAGPGWPAAKKHRLAPLANSPCTAVEVLGIIQARDVPHGDFEKLGNALTACGSAANFNAIVGHEANLDNIPTLVALAQNGDQAVQFLGRVDVDTFRQLLTAYPKTGLYDPVHVLDAHEVRDDWAGDVGSILYHHKKHVLDQGLAHSVANYTAHAIGLRDGPVGHRTPTPAGDGTKVRVGAQGCSYRNADDKIFTAWYQDE